jgi:hypothetical protein
MIGSVSFIFQLRFIMSIFFPCKLLYRTYSIGNGEVSTTRIFTVFFNYEQSG